MPKTILILPLVLGLMLSHVVCAEVASEIKLAGKPGSKLNNGLTEMCSVRVIGVKESKSPDQPSDGIDFSFSIGTQGGMVKIATYDVSSSKQKKQKPKIVPISSAWLKMSEGEITSPLDGKFHVNLETSGSIMYETSAESIAALFDDLHSGFPIEIGIQRLSENENRVYSGIVKLTGADQKQIAGCLEDLVKGIEAGKHH
jgi:hypothetical protein